MATEASGELAEIAAGARLSDLAYDRILEALAAAPAAPALAKPDESTAPDAAMTA